MIKSDSSATSTIPAAAIAFAIFALVGSSRGCSPDYEEAVNHITRPNISDLVRTPNGEIMDKSTKKVIRTLHGLIFLRDGRVWDTDTGEMIDPANRNSPHPKFTLEAK